MLTVIRISLVVLALVLATRAARRRRVVRDGGGVYDAKTGYYIQGTYTPRTFPGASDPIVMPNGGWNPDRPQLCLACGDQLQMYLVELYCCMGCSQWGSRHVTNPDCSCEDGVRIRVHHYDEVKEAILTGTYAGYDADGGVRLRPAGHRPTVEEQFALVEQFVARQQNPPRYRVELEAGPIETDAPGFPCWRYRAFFADTSAAQHYGFHPLYWSVRWRVPVEDQVEGQDVGQEEG